jgi:hypothetical protein
LVIKLLNVVVDCGRTNNGPDNKWCSNSRCYQVCPDKQGKTNVQDKDNDGKEIDEPDKDRYRTEIEVETRKLRQSNESGFLTYKGNFDKKLIYGSIFHIYCL